MAERHTMVNFYLLVAGVVTSGVVAVLGQGADLPKSIGTVLLWLLCGIGWLYFLGIIRLRQAWHESARTMNRIKEFYIEHVDGMARTSCVRPSAGSRKRCPRPASRGPCSSTQPC